MGGRIFGGLAVLATLAALVGVTVAPPAAWAHNSLTGSDPANGARLAKPPSAVRLTFLSTVKPATTKITVTGPDGSAVAAGTPVFAGRKVTVKLRPGAAGEYTVAYQIASDDGHPVKGRIRFTAAAGNAPATGATPTPEPTPSASEPAPTSPVPSPVAAPAADTDGGAGLSLAIAAAVALIVAGGLVWLRRSRRAG